MVNPLQTYFMVKRIMIAQSNCPHCRHSIEVLRTHEPHITQCRTCGKQIKVVSGKTYSLKKQGRENNSK